MNLRRLGSSLSVGLFLLAVPLLTGANGNGCGGDVSVGGDGGGAGTACSVDSDCTVESESCLLCGDGSCGPTACVSGTCQKTCPDDPPGDACNAALDCPQIEICKFCPDESCAEIDCVSGTCGWVCPPPAGGECTVAMDCPQIEICEVCSDGSCAEIDCQNGTCGWLCPDKDVSCEGNELFLEVKGDGADQTYTFADCYTDQPPSGPVEARLVHHVGAPTGLSIRSCSGEVAWITLYGDSTDVLPGELANASTDYVRPNGSELGDKDTTVAITFFGEVGEIVEGSFTSHLDVGPSTPITLTGTFRACRAADGQDP